MTLRLVEVGIGQARHQEVGDERTPGQRLQAGSTKEVHQTLYVREVSNREVEPGREFIFAALAGKERLRVVRGPNPLAVLQADALATLQPQAEVVARCMRPLDQKLVVPLDIRLGRRLQQGQSAVLTQLSAFELVSKEFAGATVVLNLGLNEVWQHHPVVNVADRGNRARKEANLSRRTQ